MVPNAPTPDAQRLVLAPLLAQAPQPADQMLLQLIKAHEQVIDSLRAALKPAESLSDEATVDMLVGAHA